MPAPSQFQALTLFEDARHVRRLTGAGLMRDLLAVRANVDTIFIYDDFLTEAVDQTNGFWIDKVSGAGASAETVPDTANGILRLIGGTDDNGYAGSVGQLSFNTSLNPLMVTSIRVNAVTSFKVEVGWLDAQTHAGAVNAYDTPTSTAADYAVAVCDTDGTNGDRWAFITDGSTANMNATATQSGEAFGSVPATLTTAAANVYDRIGITLRAESATVTKAQMYRNGKRLAAHGATLASQIKGAIAIAPWLFFQTRVVTTNRRADVDYAIIMQDRS